MCIRDSSYRDAVMTEAANVARSLRLRSERDVAVFEALTSDVRARASEDEAEDAPLRLVDESDDGAPLPTPEGAASMGASASPQSIGSPAASASVRQGSTKGGAAHCGAATGAVRPPSKGIGAAWGVPSGCAS